MALFHTWVAPSHVRSSVGTLFCGYTQETFFCGYTQTITVFCGQLRNKTLFCG